MAERSRRKEEASHKEATRHRRRLSPGHLTGAWAKALTAPPTTFLFEGREKMRQWLVFEVLGLLGQGGVSKSPSLPGNCPHPGQMTKFRLGY